MEFFVARLIGTIPEAYVKDFSGKRRLLKWGEACLVTKDEKRRIGATGQFEFEPVNLNDLLEMASRQTETKRIRLKTDFLEAPDRRGTFFADFNGLQVQERIVLMHILTRLSLADYHILAVADEIPPEASDFYGSHGVGWLMLSDKELLDLDYQFDYVIGLDSVKVGQQASLFKAVPFIPSFDDLKSFEVSDRILSFKEKDWKKENEVLVFGRLSPEIISEINMRTGLDVRTVAVPISNSTERFEAMKRAKIFVNLTESRFPVFEREAAHLGCRVVSRNHPDFSSVKVNSDSEILPAILKANEQPPPSIDWRKRMPLSPKTTSTEVEALPSFFFVHTFSTGKTGADIAALSLASALKEKFEILFVGIKRSSSSKVPESVDVKLNAPNEVVELLKKARPRAIIADSSIARLCKETVPTAKVAGIVNFLGDVSSDITNPFSTIAIKTLSDLDVVISPSKHVSKQLQKHGVKSIVLEPLVDWARGKFEKRRKQKLVFIPILYPHPDDIDFAVSLFRSLPEWKFIIGQVRGGASFDRFKNVEVKWQEDISNVFSKSVAVLFFSRVPPTFSIAAWEALAAGVPVIAEPVGAWRDLPRIAKLERDSSKWVERLCEIEAKKGPAFGGFAGQFTAAFQRRHFAGKEDWQEFVADFIKVEGVSLVFKESGFLGVDRYFSELAKVVPSSAERTFQVYSILDRNSSGGVSCIASSFEQLIFDKQEQVLAEAAERLKSGVDIALISPDEKVVFAINQLCKRPLAFRICPAAKPAQVDSSDRIFEGSVAIIATAPPPSLPRKLVLENILIAGSAGVQRLHLSSALRDYAPFARNLGIEVSIEPHRAQEEYWKWLSNMNAVLAFSAAEAFCYAAWDALSLGVPCVLSEMVALSKYLPPSWNWLILPMDATIDEASKVLKRAMNLSIEERIQLRTDMVEVSGALARQAKRDLERLFNRIA